MYLIGIDIGTSSSKGALVSKQGEVLATGRRSHQVEYSRPGWAEQDADKLWWRETVELIRELLAKSKVPASKIAAIGCSGVCPVIVPIDQDGQALRKAILYSIDSRSTAQIQQLNAAIGPDRIMQACGQPLTYQSIMPKLLWLKENEPHIWQQTRCVLSASGYLVYRLSGSTVMDHFTAADGGFGYAPDKYAWDEEGFRAAGISAEIMPQLCWPAEIAGYVSSEAALMTGLQEGTPVICGTGDALSEMISTGVSEVGETSLLYGSTLSLMTLMDHVPAAYKDIATYPGWEKGQLLAAAGIRSGMSSFTWLRRLCGYETDEQLFERAQADLEKAPLGADGLLILPFLSSEKTEFTLNTRIKGAFLGLSQHHDIGHVLRALMEGIGFALRLSMESIPRISTMRVVGGGAKNRYLLQIISDICRCTQQVISGHVGAPLGSAWLAGVGVNLLSKNTSKSWVEIADKVDPVETHSVEYDLIYERFVELTRQKLFE